MSSFAVGTSIGLVIVVLSIWGIRRGLYVWGGVGIVLAIGIVLFVYWSDDVVTDEPGIDGSGVATIPFDAFRPGSATPGV